MAISLYSSIEQSVEVNMLNTYHYRVENNVLHLCITYQSWIIKLVFVFMSVYWRHICHDVSQHREFYCLLNCLFMVAAQGTSKLLRVDFAAYCLYKGSVCETRCHVMTSCENVAWQKCHSQIGNRFTLSKKRGFSSQIIKSKMGGFILSFSRNKGNKNFGQQRI